MTKYVNNNGVSEIWLNIKNWVTSQLLGYSQTGHTHSASDITSGLSTVATSGSYNDLSNKPTIPTVNNATLTIQKNGTTVDTFTANASSNVTANISVPTKTSDLTNDSNFITEDATKIPLSGSNQISGDLIPSTNETVNLGSLNNVYNITYSKVFSSGSDTSKHIGIYSGNNHWGDGAALILYGKTCTLDGMSGGEFVLAAVNGLGWYQLKGFPNGTLTWGSKNVAMQEDVVPRSGGAVITGNTLARNVDGGQLHLCASTSPLVGPTISLYGGDGAMQLLPSLNGNYKEMKLVPDGTLIWSGQPIQYVSDKRVKQQITEIDDKLLDAWEDVEPVQFKYNDAVETKSDNARLHTGYVVQQIDEACKSHNVDISEYGLYCHEEYPQETEEVEVEQADGTKTKERKVIREASEHYSLRYTEALIVECAYLRKCIKELRNEIEELKSSK